MSFYAKNDPRFMLSGNRKAKFLFEQNDYMSMYFYLKHRNTALYAIFDKLDFCHILLLIK